MRIAIIANSLPNALAIESELRSLRYCECFLVIARAPGESSLKAFAKTIGRFLLKHGRIRSLGYLLKRRVVFFGEKLDTPRAVAKLKALELDVGLHKSGSIYRQATMDAFRLGILNAHIGILPQYRGRNVMEWAILEGGPVGITVFFVDTGIDTGKRIVLSDEVDISHHKTINKAKNYLFSLDAVYFRRAIESLHQGDVEFQLNDGSGRRYYVMSRLFQGVVEEMLKQ